MDLLQTVRKEGSRGGRGEFKWSDVQNSSHREHYLGHSLMAPVGRWAKGRDLNWYAKGTDSETPDEDPASKAEQERKNEIRRVKEAEEDAMARAMGLPVPDRSNANLEPVNDKRGGSGMRGTEEKDASRGIGYNSHKRTGSGQTQDKELQGALKEYRRRHGDETSRRDRHRNRSRSRSRDRYKHRRRDQEPASRRGHERNRDRDRDRDRDRESIHDRDHDRGRDRDNEHEDDQESNTRHYHTKKSRHHKDRHHSRENRRRQYSRSRSRSRSNSRSRSPRRKHHPARRRGSPDHPTLRSPRRYS